MRKLLGWDRKAELLGKHVKNIYVCPKPLREDSATQLTLGDLHGNSVKLLYFLVRHIF